MGASMSLPELLSQLEESKFLRLFRYLNAVREHRPWGRNIHGLSVPLDLVDAELSLSH